MNCLSDGAVFHVDQPKYFAVGVEDHRVITNLPHDFSGCVGNRPTSTRRSRCSVFSPARPYFAILAAAAAWAGVNNAVYYNISASGGQNATQRDATLEMPRLILPAIQVNMRGGHLPPPEDDGTSYLKMPVNKL